MNYPINYQVKKYRPRELTKQQLAFCEIYLADGIAGKAARLAGYKSPYRNANQLLKCKRIQDYLNKRMKQIETVPVTFESKVEVLKHVIDAAIPLDQPLTDNVDKGLKAIAELNKMQGHYAAIETRNLNINADAKIESDQAKELMKQLIESNKRPY